MVYLPTINILVSKIIPLHAKMSTNLLRGGGVDFASFAPLKSTTVLKCNACFFVLSATLCGLGERRCDLGNLKVCSTFDSVEI